MCAWLPTEIQLAESEEEHSAESEEYAWVARVRAGDVPAFEALYRAYHARLRAFVANYVRSNAQAEEIVQDLMCRLWEQRAALQVKGTLRSYLYFAARNRAINATKRTSVAVRAEEQWTIATPEDVLVPGMGQGLLRPDDGLQRRDLLVAIRLAVDALPPRSRQAWILRWQHELPHSEIATVMGVSVKAVEALLARSRRSLQDALAQFRS